ncbi:MAG: hypothetical protein WCE80_15310 [Acidimicrobiia bacterium]
MRVVEFLGVPGSGKTTLAEALPRAIPGALSLDDGARMSLRHGGADGVTRLAARLTRSSDSRLWSMAYARSSDRMAALVRFVSARPALMERVVAALGSRADRDIRPDLVLGWVVNLMARYQLATEDARASWLVVDEGFAQRAVALFAAGYEPSDDGEVREYLTQSPVPDVLVVVETPLEVCTKRLGHRGWSERLVDVGAPAQRRFLEAAETIVSRVDAAWAGRGVEVLRVSGEAPPSDSISLIAATLAPRANRGPG